MKKLWEKSTQINKKIEHFTIGRDKELDLLLAAYDILGSIAHANMLTTVGLLKKEELQVLSTALKQIYQTTLDGTFSIEDGVEDVHSQVELILTRKLGNIGKKIHSGRSRNDQILLDLKLYARAEIERTVQNIGILIDTLLQLSERYKTVLMPGYTHLQIAMPSSFGLWFGAYAESLTDDLIPIQAAWKITNKNPLGSAAGYGSSFPLDREQTTTLLGFDAMNYNVVYAQMGRGKMERTVANALSGVAATISKLAYDACLFSSQNFSFIQLPDDFTTGSSIMPHKKNPDVFELIRSKCNRIQALPNEIAMITNNLPTGYFRDLQTIKEIFLPMFDELNNCLEMTTMMMDKITINTEILNDSKYDYLFSVEEVNKLVLLGTPFRDAYKKVGLDIEEGNFVPNKILHHTHQGSIGNLCNNNIAQTKKEVLASFHFEKIQQAIHRLLE